MSFLKKIASLFTSTNETPVTKGWVVADTGAKVWDEEPLPGEIVKWSGAMDDEGYATGIGLLQFIQKGKVGVTFEGQMLKGKYNGKGIYKWADGDVYEGQFVHNEPNGKGIFRYVNGDFYEGDVVDGNFHGRGVKRIHCCGITYEGEFADDEYHGRGILKYDDGSSYDGDFVEGEYSGKGIFRYADGSYYEGSFIDGEMYGYGTLYSKEGTILKQGQWEDGEIVAQAVGENIHNGSIFQTVQLKDAICDYNLKKEFIYRIDDYEKSSNTMVRVYKGDAHIEGDMNLLSLFSDQGIAGIIVEGSLTISGSLVDGSTRSLASFLLVTADLYAENIIAGHAIISIHGKAAASNVIIGHSGTGSMDVKGDLQAKLLIAQDHLILVSGKIDAVTMTDSRSKQYIRQDYQSWQEILIPEAADELLSSQGTLKKSKEILRRILKSAPIFRSDLAAKLTSVAIGSDVEKGCFVSWSEMKKYLAELRDGSEEPLFSYRGDDDMEEEVLLLYEGNTVFDEMDLDAREFAVVIKGNLTVQGNITNSNTDGATSLIVLGNLHAQNIAVGGQTFHVRGNLTAEGILCGSYNHGDMYVGGDVKAQLILSDDYFFQFQGKVTGQQLDAWHEDDLTELVKVLDKSVFDDEEDGPNFNFYTLQEALMAGRPVLNNYFWESKNI